MTTPATLFAAHPGSRLADLAAQYDAAKARADEAEAALKAITDGIKAELGGELPGIAKIDLTADGLERPLRLSYVERWDLDSKRMKADDPVLYVRYARKSGRWQLSRVRGTS